MNDFSMLLANLTHGLILLLLAVAGYMFYKRLRFHARQAPQVNQTERESEENAVNNEVEETQAGGNSNIDNLQPADSEKTQKTVENALTCLQCHYKKETRGEAGYAYLFEYQSAKFVLYLNTNSGQACVEMPSIAYFENEQKPLVHAICNRFNVQSTHCYVYFQPIIETWKLSLTLSVSIGRPALDSRIFHRTLSFALSRFFVAIHLLQDIHRDLEQQSDENGTADPEWVLSENLRELMLAHELEKPHRADDLRGKTYINTYTKEQPVHPTTLAELMRVAFDVQKEAITDVKTIGTIPMPDGGLITDFLSTNVERDTMLKDLLLDEQDSSIPYFRNSVVSIIVEADSSQGKNTRYSIILSSEHESEKSLYFRADCVRLSKPISPSNSLDGTARHTDAFSILLAHDKDGGAQLEAKAKYLIDELTPLADIKHFNKLTPEQRFLMRCGSPDTARCIFIGRQLMRKRRYFEALSYLENAYYAISAQAANITQSSFDAFYQLMYYIGFCYNKVGAYEKAFFYLDPLFPLNRIEYTKQYVIALTNNHDFRAYDIVERLLSQISDYEQQQEVPALEPYLIEFRRFLLGRKAYILVDRGNWFEAEELLKKLLKNDPDSDFLLKELAYIQRLKQDEEETNKNDLQLFDTTSTDSTSPFLFGDGDNNSNDDEIGPPY